MAARFPDAVVIGSDQVADLDGEPLGKPGTHERAVAQLRQMRGQTVVFQTAVAVVCAATRLRAGRPGAGAACSFATSSDAEIENYLRAEQPYDCAGSAKSEGLGIALLDAHRQRRPDRAGRPAADPHLPHAARRRRARCCARAEASHERAAKGKLYLVPAPLDFGCDAQAPLQDVLPAGTLQVAATPAPLDLRKRQEHARLPQAGRRGAAAAAAGAGAADPELPREVHKKGDHGGGFDARPLLAPALEGHDIGLVSEAGMPAIADPGSSVVRAAHDLGMQVVPLVGPVSLLLALAASGLNGQNFAFVGYLPQEAAERSQRIRELEALALKTGQTQLFIETPYRNTALLQALLQTLQPNTRLAVSSGLTLADGRSHSAPVSAWNATSRRRRWHCRRCSASAADLRRKKPAQRACLTLSAGSANRRNRLERAHRAFADGRAEASWPGARPRCRGGCSRRSLRP